MKTARHLPRLVALVLTVLASLAPGAAHARSWCAVPLWVHEWGVQVFDGAGAPQGAPVALPVFFHRRAPALHRGGGGAVRDLPMDTGERDLPVIHFYAPERYGERVPVGVEVGFAQGEASVWFPQVDRARAAAQANSAEAAAARAALLTARAARTPMGGGGGGALPADPTRQLVWEQLTLTPDPQGEAAEASATPWVGALRGLDGALWVGRGSESERFLFYEATTHERPQLEVTRGAQWAPGHEHYALRNASAHPVHDVLVVRREGGRVWSFYAPMIPAGASAGFLFTDAAADAQAAADFEVEARARLARALTDHAQPAPQAAYDPAASGCVMGRDPALPTEAAVSHRLYAAEVEALLDVWAPRLLGQQGTVIVYREDTARLDALMPLSIYTDMFHDPVVHRAGLVLWEGLDLAALSAP